MLHVLAFFFFFFSVCSASGLQDFSFLLCLDISQILPVSSGIVAHKVQIRARIKSTL